MVTGVPNSLWGTNRGRRNSGVLTVFSVRLRVEAGETDVELIIQHVAIPWLRPLVDGLSLRWPGFDPITVHVTFLVDKLALGQVYL